MRTINYHPFSHSVLPTPPQWHVERERRRGKKNWVEEEEEEENLVGALSPVNHRGSLSELKTKFSLSLSYSIHKSLNHKSILFFFFFSLSFFFFNHNSVFHKETNSTQHTSNFMEQTNLSRKVKIILTISKCRPRDTMTPGFERIYIPWAFNTGTCINCLWGARWPILFCGPTQEPAVTTANRKNSGEMLEKNAGEWSRRI